MTDFNEDINETILDIETSDSQEPSCVEPGEYQIRITGFRKDAQGKIVRTSEKGSKYFIITFDIPNEEFSKGLSKVFSVPSEGMEPKRVNAIKWDLECFKRAFGLATLDFNDMVGREGWAMLKTTSSPQYGEQNEVAKFITGPAENSLR